VTFLDDDDELLPEMLEVSLRAAERSSLPRPVAVVSGIETVRPDGSTLEIRLPASMPKGKDYFLEPGSKARASIGNTLVVGRDLLIGIGGFDESLRASVHSELFLRLNPVCSVEGLPVVTYTLRRHAGPHVHMNEIDRARAMELTIRKHGEAFRRHPEGHARFLAAAGIAYLKSGRWSDAVRCGTRAVRIHPWDPKVLWLWLATLGGPPLLSAYRRLTRAVHVGGADRAG
jgi:hypothetical protein